MLGFRRAGRVAPKDFPRAKPAWLSLQADYRIKYEFVGFPLKRWELRRFLSIKTISISSSDIEPRNITMMSRPRPWLLS